MLLSRLLNANNNSENCKHFTTKEYIVQILIIPYYTRVP